MLTTIITLTILLVISFLINVTQFLIGRSLNRIIDEQDREIAELFAIKYNKTK